jgi:hypothetical protein
LIKLATAAALLALLPNILPGPDGAFAQPIVATPLAPPPGTTPQQPPPNAAGQPLPTLQQPIPPSENYPPVPSAPVAPQPPAVAQPPAVIPPPVQGEAQAPAEQGAPPAGVPPVPEAPQWANVWVPRASADLQFLDKVNAQTSTATVKVGQSIQFESLTVQVAACDVRPPDQPADATAYLVISDSHPDAPGFKGWMLRSDPSVSMLEHPLYDVRVLGCGG